VVFLVFRGAPFRARSANRYRQYLADATLVVDIFDGQKQRLIWRGKQSDALSGNPEKMNRSSQRTSLICSNTSLHHTEGMLDQLHGIEGPLTSQAFIHIY
jgi:hypothetical protein